MSILLRPILTKCFLILYLVGIVSSIVTVPDGKDSHMYEWAPYELFVDVYVVSAFVLLLRWALQKVRYGTMILRIIMVLFYAITYSLYIVDTFCFVKFGSTLNPSILLLMGETTGSEATEFLQTYITSDLLVSDVAWMVLIPLLHIAVTIEEKTIQKRIAPVIPAWCHKPLVNNVLGAVIGVAVITCGALTYSNKTLYAYTMSQNTIGDVEHTLAYKPHTELYQPPMRLAFAVYCNQLIARQLDKLIQTTENVRVDSCSVKSPEIVLIIGESFNKRHAQLYGYDKENMPNQVRMEKEGRLVKFDDVVSPWNLTSFVFKHLMTTYCVGDKGEWCDYPLFCQLFRKAGYRVNFITNQFQTQAKQAVYDFSGGFFINNQTLSDAQFDYRNKKLYLFDDKLLEEWNNALHNDSMQVVRNQPHLNIFHLMGQHVSYRIRYPNRMRKWGAKDYPNDSDMLERNIKTMSHYDNATWFNDSVVNQIVERFKDDDAIIIYLPDHGEEVYGPGARHFCGRMHNTTINKRWADEEVRIPFWIYTTHVYAEKRPEVIQAIKDASTKRYMTDAVSHLLLGLAGIHTPYYKPQYDILSSQYDESRKRIIKNQADYDTLK